MTRKMQLKQDQLEQEENAHRETKSAFIKYSSNLRASRNQLQNIRKEHSLLQDLYSKDIQNWKLYLQSIKNTLQKGNQFNYGSFSEFIYYIEMKITIDKYTQQIDNHRTEIEQYQQQIKYEQKDVF
jgi:chromosome segregation ATPase